jgi:hypothetical protein
MLLLVTVTSEQLTLAVHRESMKLRNIIRHELIGHPRRRRRQPVPAK